MSIFSKKATPVNNPQNGSSKAADIALQAIIDGVLMLDSRGAITMTNPAGARIAGFQNPSDMVGLHYASVLNLSDEQGHTTSDSNTEFDQAFKNNQILENHKYTLHPQNNAPTITIAITLSPTNADDPQSSKVVVFRDIARAAQAENQQMDFIATASHEMRTPVASIEGYLSLALNPQTATIDDRARQYLDEAHSSCKHLGDLFRDLLDVTKIDDSQMQLHLTPIELNQTVQDIVRQYNPAEITKKQLHLAFGAPGAPNNASVQQVLYTAVDINCLSEIVNNLLENAVKYTPENGRIWIGTTGDAETVTLSVADTGIGINPEDAEHIFQRFYRVDNSDTRTIGGTGLGLYLVKRRAELMNGRVWVESTPGKGSTFYVSLPRLSDTEYERMRIAVENAEALAASQTQTSPQNNNNQPQGGNNG